MTGDNSIWGYLWQASWPVKTVIVILLATSVVSWAMILRRSRQVSSMLANAREFEARFWSCKDVASLYKTTQSRKHPNLAEQVFLAGYTELLPLLERNSADRDSVIVMANRAMETAQGRCLERIAHYTSFLATIGSTSPYLGLFGTVWGIINAFQALGVVQQATIAMVAPGISEALVTTALGLLVAIPAVVAYNRLSSQLNLLDGELARFQSDLVRLACRQIQAS